MSEWISFVKEYAVKNNIKYQDALKAASDAYKNRNVKPIESVERALGTVGGAVPPIKPKRQYNKKVKDTPLPPPIEIKTTRKYTKNVK